MQIKEGRGRTTELNPEEMEARMLTNFRHYGATTCIYLLIGKNYLQQEKGINVWGMYDSGSVVTEYHAAGRELWIRNYRAGYGGRLPGHHS